MPAAASFLLLDSCNFVEDSKTVWPSGLRRWLKAPFRKGVGLNPTAVNAYSLQWAALPMPVLIKELANRGEVGPR